jgi:hypothetical protein
MRCSNNHSFFRRDENTRLCNTATASLLLPYLFHQHTRRNHRHVVTRRCLVIAHTRHSGNLIVRPCTVTCFRIIFYHLDADQNLPPEGLRFAAHLQPQLRNLYHLAVSSIFIRNHATKLKNGVESPSLQGLTTNLRKLISAPRKEESSSNFVILNFIIFINFTIFIRLTLSYFYHWLLLNILSLIL